MWCGYSECEYWFKCIQCMSDLCGGYIEYDNRQYDMFILPCWIILYRWFE